MRASIRAGGECHRNGSQHQKGKKITKEKGEAGPRGKNGDEKRSVYPPADDRAWSLDTPRRKLTRVFRRQYNHGSPPSCHGRSIPCPWQRRRSRQFVSRRSRAGRSDPQSYPRRQEKRKL